MSIKYQSCLEAAQRVEWLEVERMIYIGYKLHPDLTMEAAKYGQMWVFEMLLQNGCKWHTDAVYECLKYHRTECALYCLQHNAPFAIEDLYLTESSPLVTEWICTHIIPTINNNFLLTIMLSRCIENNSLHVCTWLVDHYSEMCRDHFDYKRLWSSLIKYPEIGQLFLLKYGLHSCYQESVTSTRQQQLLEIQEGIDPSHFNDISSDDRYLLLTLHYFNYFVSIASKMDEAYGDDIETCMKWFHPKTFYSQGPIGMGTWKLNSNVVTIGSLIAQLYSNAKESNPITTLHMLANPYIQKQGQRFVQYIWLAIEKCWPSMIELKVEDNPEYFATLMYWLEVLYIKYPTIKHKTVSHVYPEWYVHADAPYVEPVIDFVHSYEPATFVVAYRSEYHSMMNYSFSSKHNKHWTEVLKVASDLYRTYDGLYAKILFELTTEGHFIQHIVQPYILSFLFFDS